MREIKVDTDVFAKIWSLRAAGESDENEILNRILGVGVEAEMLICGIADRDDTEKHRGPIAEAPVSGKVRWIDDVEHALRHLGGQATLHRIYQQVRKQRAESARSQPRSLEAIVRRCIEEQSSDSEAFKGASDLFEHVSRGEWKLRHT